MVIGPHNHNVDKLIVVEKLTTGGAAEDDGRIRPGDILHSVDGNPVTDITGSNVGNLLNSGWSLVGNYNDLTDNVYKSVNGGQVSSSYWIISAFSRFGAATGGDSTLDYFKLEKIAGEFTCVNSNDPGCNNNNNQTPEPASLALVAVALAGVAGSRRRRKVEMQA